MTPPPSTPANVGVTMSPQASWRQRHGALWPGYSSSGSKPDSRSTASARAAPPARREAPRRTAAQSLHALPRRRTLLSVGAITRPQGKWAARQGTPAPGKGSTGSSSAARKTSAAASGSTRRDTVASSSACCTGAMTDLPVDSAETARAAAERPAREAREPGSTG